MDFDDILRLLVYIAIPLIVSANRKAKQAKKSQNNRRPQQADRQPVQNERRPVQGGTAGGGLMGRLESMIKELEKAAEAQKPAGGAKVAGQTAKPVSGGDVYPAAETAPASAEGREGYSAEMPAGIPVWQAAQAGVGGQAASPYREAASPLSADEPDTDSRGEHVLFGRNDLVKGIIMSEILQPPVALRPRKRRPY